ncbi:MAG TPA: hypothetical protein VE978_21285 [Chitinophagales bacterium]|nr:hypothetical protein [Chitinophagales bacterium]
MSHSKIFLPIFFCLTSHHSFAISISEAVKQKLISITVHSYDDSKDSVFHPSYYGSCIVFDIRNLKANTLELTEDAGRFLIPNDSAEQRMIITSPVTLALLAHQQKFVPVYAMCTEAHDAGPSNQTKFTYGEIAQANLLKLVKMIAKNKFQDKAAQNAVWCITDNFSPSTIYSTDTAEAHLLCKLVCALKNIPYAPGIAPEPDIDFPHSARINGYFTYTIARTHTIDLRIYNQQGQLLKDVVHGEKQTPGTYNYNYEADIPVNDDRHPPVMIVRFYFDGKIFAEKKHVLR